MESFVFQVVLLFHVMIFVSLAACEALLDLNAALTTERTLTIQRLQDLEERRHRYEVLLEDLLDHNTDEDKDMETAAIVQGLETIARRSSADMVVLTRQLELQRNEAEHRHQLAAERQAEEQSLLRQRWWKATRTYHDKRKEMEATAQASLEEAAVLRAKTVAALQEAERLRRSKERMDGYTEQIRARQEALMRQGMLAQWWHHLTGIFTSDDAIKTPDLLSPNPSQDAADTGIGIEDIAPGSNEAHPTPNDSDDGGEEDTDGTTSDDRWWLVRPSDSEGDGQESDGPASDAEHPSLPNAPAIAKDVSDYEIATNEGAGSPQAEFSGATLGDKKRRGFKWQVALHAVLSAVFAAFRILARFRRRRGGRRRGLS